MVVSWAYAASYQKPISVPQSLILQMPRFGADVVLAHPPEFKLMPEIMQQAKDNAKKYGVEHVYSQTEDDRVIVTATSRKAKAPTKAECGTRTAMAFSMARNAGP